MTATKDGVSTKPTEARTTAASSARTQESTSPHAQYREDSTSERAELELEAGEEQHEGQPEERKYLDGWIDGRPPESGGPDRRCRLRSR
jgi:hypothetical protein